MKICFVASAGGHMLQLLKLDNISCAHESVYVTTSELLSKKLSQRGIFYAVGESNRQHPVRILKVLWKCIRIIAREKPDVVISTGASVGCIMGVLCKLRGGKVIWVDSITNVSRPSMSGRLIRPFADLFFVQWDRLSEPYNARYVGTLI